MRLEYKELLIRHAEDADAELLCRWWNDGAVMAHAGFPNGLGTDPQKIRESLASDSDETRRRLIVEYCGKPIGEMCWRREKPGVADIGIKICESQYQERGLGRILLSMLIRYLFDSGYGKIVLDTDLENTRAQHVYEKLGFRKLRVNRDSWTNQLGEPRSSVDYELTAEYFVDFAADKETAEQMWARFGMDAPYEAWSYGDDPDTLAQLTLDGVKTATASAYPLYEPEGEPIPKAGEYSVIQWEDGTAACIIQTTRVCVIPYKDVSADHAWKEGEGDRSLDYWRRVHEAFFREELAQAGLSFDEEMGVVCEEFQVVFK